MLPLSIQRQGSSDAHLRLLWLVLSTATAAAARLHAAGVPSGWSRHNPSSCSSSATAASSRRCASASAATAAGSAGVRRVERAAPAVNPAA